MKRKQTMIIVIAVIAFVGLWMYSQSGNASPLNCVGVSSNQISSDTIMLIDS